MVSVEVGGTGHTVANCLEGASPRIVCSSGMGEVLGRQSGGVQHGCGDGGQLRPNEGQDFDAPPQMRVFRSSAPEYTGASDPLARG